MNRKPRGNLSTGFPSGDSDEILDLFSWTHHGFTISSSGESDVMNGMDKRILARLDKAGRGAAEEFLAVEIGKHDYDWLLTPPATPVFTSIDPPKPSQRSSSNIRSASSLKSISKVCLPNHNTVSNSFQRPSCPLQLSVPLPSKARITSAAPSPFSSFSRTPSSALNSNTASLNSRPQTPSKARTNAVATAEKPKLAVQTSRPSTPTAGAHSQAPQRCRPLPPTRPDFPTTNRSSPQLIIPLKAPPNLRTKLTDGAILAGRQRPGKALTAQENLNAEKAGSVATASRKPPSPSEARGWIADNQRPAKPALKRMGIRQGPGGVRGSGVLFPHSTRAAAADAASKGRRCGSYGTTDLMPKTHSSWAQRLKVNNPNVGSRLDHSFQPLSEPEPFI